MSPQFKWLAEAPGPLLEVSGSPDSAFPRGQTRPGCRASPDTCPAPQGLAAPSGRAAAAVAVGVTASGAVYLLYRSSSGGRASDKAGRVRATKLTTLAQLQQYAGLRGRLAGGLVWATSARHLLSVCVPNQGAALGAFPEGLCSLPQLRQLNLSGSAIAELPPAVSRLSSLADLDLGRCQLRRLPPEIGALRELKYLNLMGNPLEVGG